MIIANLVGGLGNQMFQYAAGRALSVTRGQALRLDVSEFANYGLHQGFELDRVFSCPVSIATGAEVHSILGWQSAAKIRSILTRAGFAGLRRAEFIVEPHFHYWPGIRAVPRNSYLIGYWQSEKYFSEAVSVIREDFTFKLALSKRNAELVAQIDAVNAVSLHVRRGDYVQNSKTNLTHGLCSLDYYHAAIKYVATHVDRPHFFIFSDDIAWAKKNLNVEFPSHYVDHNQGADSFNDMRLMSLCKHHVIANSSFSWWGAWLGCNPEKLVVAPRCWFRNKSLDTRDLYCYGWIQL